MAAPTLSAGLNIWTGRQPYGALPAYDRRRHQRRQHVQGVAGGNDGFLEGMRKPPSLGASPVR